MRNELVYNLKYICGPVTKRFHQDTESRAKLLIGPFGTGKTSSALYDIIRKQSRRVLPTLGKIRSRFAVVRNTYPELRDTTIKTCLDWFPELYFGKYNETKKTYTIYDHDDATGMDVEVELIFKALDSAEDVRDLLSLELTGAHVDECREVKRDIIKGLMGRVGRYPSMKNIDADLPFIKQYIEENNLTPIIDPETGKISPFLSPPQISLTTNYPSSKHYLYKDFVGKPIDGYRIYECDQSENKHNLRPGYYEDLEKDYADRPDLLKTLVRGQWGVTVQGKLVYPEFTRSYHVAKTPIKPSSPTKIIRGWDNTGLCPAISLSFISPTGQWLIFKEFCFEDKGIMDATEEMILWCNQELHPNCTFLDYGDPAGKTRDTTKQSPITYIKKKAKEYGITVNIIPGIQTFKVRRESVANRLTKNINGEPALLIDPSCDMIIDGFDGGYSFAEIGKSGVYHTEPQDNEYTHIHDSLQYPATKLFRSKQEDETDIAEQLRKHPPGSRHSTAFT